MKKTGLWLTVVLGVWIVASALMPVVASTPIYVRDGLGFTGRGVATPLGQANGELAATTVVLQPGNTPEDAALLEDAYISDAAPDANYGDPNGSLQLRSTSPVIRSLLKWDLSRIPMGAYVRSARLELRAIYRTGPTTADIALYRVLVPWVEGQVTWNQASAGSLWHSEGCAGLGLDRESVPAASKSILAADTVPGWFSWDLTELVSDWLADPSSNQGMILVATGPSVRYDFGSAESGATSDRPKLIIEYDAEPPTATPTVTSDASPTLTPTTIDASPTVTNTLEGTPTSTPTITQTSGPTLTPTLTPESWLDLSRAVPAYCMSTFSGNTSGKPNNASKYGALSWPETGPEDVYVITKTVSSDLTVRLDTSPSIDLDVFLLFGPSPSSLLAGHDWELVYPDLAPGTYYIVVDGYAGDMGAYRLAIACAGEPTPMPTSTRTPTRTNTPVQSFYPMLLKESTPTPTATPTFTATPTVIPYVRAVNCGSSESFAASDGYSYEADQPFDANLPDGWGWEGGNAQLVDRTTRDIVNTEDDPIYQTHRYAMDAYRFNVPNGRYEVSLQFAEIFPITHVGDRVFDVQLENTVVMDHFDMMVAGLKYTKGEYTHFIDVIDGRLDIIFISHSYYGPAVNGIRVLRSN